MNRGRELRLYASELGRQIAVDLEPDADFNEAGGGPGHGYLLLTCTTQALWLNVWEAQRLRNAVHSVLLCACLSSPDGAERNPRPGPPHALRSLRATEPQGRWAR